MKKRTLKQNSALHLAFRQMADTLTERGLDVRTTLKNDFDIQWNERLVKELIWRPLQKKIANKASTTELTRTEIDEIFVVIQKHLGEHFGIETPFPSIETLIDQYERNKWHKK